MLRIVAGSWMQPLFLSLAYQISSRAIQQTGIRTIKGTKGAVYGSLMIATKCALRRGDSPDVSLCAE